VARPIRTLIQQLVLVVDHAVTGRLGHRSGGSEAVEATPTSLTPLFSIGDVAAGTAVSHRSSGDRDGVLEDEFLRLLSGVDAWEELLDAAQLDDTFDDFAGT
jgi:hypothetical protein